ncbi:MAG TPA: hypothetical protein VLX91_14220 [Candidatus Acidoferrales bacterium]|nr:hypothetical protein [Candidatus Acidoferrales bacterium]
MEKIKINNSGFGIIWIIGWLFTLGFLKLAFWNGVLAILIWPYYIGSTLSGLIK